MKTKLFLTVILTLSPPDSRDSASLRALFVLLESIKQVNNINAII